MVKAIGTALIRAISVFIVYPFHGYVSYMMDRAVMIITHPHGGGYASSSSNCFCAWHLSLWEITQHSVSRNDVSFIS